MSASRTPARLRSGAGWIGAGAMVVLAFVAIGLIAGEIAPEPQGPALSSYATTRDGVAAWTELLERAGHAVSQLRAPLAGASLRADGTLVVLGAQGLDRADLRAAERFVRAGGWAVLGGGALNRYRLCWQLGTTTGNWFLVPSKARESRASSRRTFKREAARI